MRVGRVRIRAPSKRLDDLVYALPGAELRAGVGFPLGGPWTLLFEYRLSYFVFSMDIEPGDWATEPMADMLEREILSHELVVGVSLQL